MRLRKARNPEEAGDSSGELTAEFFWREGKRERECEIGIGDENIEGEVGACGGR